MTLVQPLKADLYWSFRSPYSYLAIGRYREIARDHAFDIRLRPVLPLAVRQPDFFERNHPNWLRYTFMDVQRLAAYHNIPIALPQPDPIVQDLATRKVAAEQPHIYRLTRLGQAAVDAGAGLAFADAVSRLIWGGTPGWHEGGHLARAAASAGLDLATLEQTVSENEAALDAEIAGNVAALEAAGHWGVPTLVFDGEPFFGQDRIEVALWRLRQKGLQPR